MSASIFVVLCIYYVDAFFYGFKFSHLIATVLVFFYIFRVENHISNRDNTLIWVYFNLILFDILQHEIINSVIY